MADEDRVRLVGIQLPERLELDRERPDDLTVQKAEAILQHELARRRGDERVLDQLRHRVGGEG
jgi:hypothetical protein